MNICEQMRIEMPGLIRGELGADDRARLEQHLATCPVCTEELRALTGTHALIAASPLASQPPTDLEDQVFAFVDLDDVTRVVADAPLSHEPPLELEKKAFQRAGLLPGKMSRLPRVAALAAPGLAAVAVVFGFLFTEMRSDLDRMQDQYGSHGQTMELLTFGGEDSAHEAAKAEVVRYEHDNYRIYLQTHYLEPTPQGYHYELWLRGAANDAFIGSFKVQNVESIPHVWDVAVNPLSFSEAEITLKRDGEEFGSAGQAVIGTSLSPLLATPSP